MPNRTRNVVLRAERLRHRSKGRLCPPSAPRRSFARTVPKSRSKSSWDGDDALWAGSCRTRASDAVGVPQQIHVRRWPFADNDLRTARTDESPPLPRSRPGPRPTELWRRRCAAGEARVRHQKPRVCAVWRAVFGARVVAEGRPRSQGPAVGHGYNPSGFAGRTWPSTIPDRSRPAPGLPPAGTAATAAPPQPVAATVGQHTGQPTRRSTAGRRNVRLRTRRPSAGALGDRRAPLGGLFALGDLPAHPDQRRAATWMTTTSDSGCRPPSSVPSGNST